MGFQVQNQRYRKAEQGILPFFGVASYTAPRTEATILGLQSRGPTPDRLNPVFSVTSGPGTAYFYAYPVSYGEATFNEVNASGVIIGLGPGAWDGAHGDPLSEWGPVIVPVNIGGNSVDFYLYVSDWPDLGQTYWRVD